MKSLPRTPAPANLHDLIAAKVSSYMARLRRRRVPEAVMRDVEQEAWSAALAVVDRFDVANPGARGFFFTAISRHVGPELARWATPVTITRDLARAGSAARRAAGAGPALPIGQNEGEVSADDLPPESITPEDWVSARERAAAAAKLQRRYGAAVRRAEVRMPRSVRNAGRMAKLGRTATDDAAMLGVHPRTVGRWRVEYDETLRVSGPIRQSLQDMEALFT